MSFKYKLLVWVSLPIVIFDQLSKYLVNQYVVLGERISLVQGYLDLVHFRNPGAAFGMLARHSYSCQHYVDFLSAFAFTK